MEWLGKLGKGHYFTSGNKGQPFLPILAQDHLATSSYLPCCRKCSEGNNRLITSFSVPAHWLKSKLGKQENKYNTHTHPQKNKQTESTNFVKGGKKGYWLLLLLGIVPKDTSEMYLKVWHKTLLGKKVHSIILWTLLLGDRRLKLKHIPPISASYLA